MKLKLLIVVLVSFAFFHDATAQKSNKKITITGTVIDKTNNPVRGVLIMIDGNTTEVKTNDKGSYKIKVRPSVSKIGVFTTLTGAKEEPVNGRTVIDFKLDKMIVQAPLSTNSSVGDEVIDEGYGSTNKKANSTKSVSRTDVSGSQYASFSSIYEVLRTVPGVMVSGSSVSVRGIGTTGSSAPLYVVNGVTMSNIGSINPSMVKSIEVLKGPAASVYGLQGANGVIMIRLK